MKHTLPANKNSSVRSIAIGGITKENCNSAVLKHFDGIAVLGSIWLDKSPLQEFKLIQQTWNTTGRHY